MSTNDIRLITFSNYIKPKPQVNKSKGWVLNGKNNSFYQYVIDRNNGSTTNASINSSYTDLIYGRGLSVVGGDLSKQLQVKEVLNDKDVRRVVDDFQLFGEASMFVTPKRNGNLDSVTHLPKNLTAPSIIDEDWQINSYFVSADWSKLSQNPPEEYDVFGDNLKTQTIYNIKPYSAGDMYFANPSYYSALQYCEVEEEISNMYITSIKQGLSAGYIINIPDGITWTPEQKNQFETKVKQKLTGTTNTSNFIISFQGRDVSITVEPFPVNENVHKQWEFLTDEAIQKILTAHKATSPSLVGIISSSGFSNTADEMDTAEEQLMKRVIQPKQRYLLESFESILTQYGINVQLYFKPLTETKISLSEHKHDEFAELELYAEDYPEGYELTDGSEYDLQLASTANSEQDTDLWKTRYQYSIGTSKTPQGQSRTFCNRMMNLASQNKVFRKEDIEKMSANGVNGKFAHSGGKYDIFLYAGGVNCYHRWERRVFKKKRNEDGDVLGGNAMQNTTPVSVSEARRQGYKPPKNNPDVAIAEITKPNKGAYPS